MAVDMCRAIEADLQYKILQANWERERKKKFAGMYNENNVVAQLPSTTEEQAIIKEYFDCMIYEGFGGQICSLLGNETGYAFRSGAYTPFIELAP